MSEDVSGDTARTRKREATREMARCSSSSFSSGVSFLLVVLSTRPVNAAKALFSPRTSTKRSHPAGHRVKAKSSVFSADSRANRLFCAQ
eukprot:2059945-Pyramimonas_sp.AAC.2